MTVQTTPALPVVRDELRECLAEILYCDVAEIDDDLPFQELGLDSVLGLDLLSVINSRYGRQDRVDVIYDHPTLNKLAEHVCATSSTESRRENSSGT